MTRFPADFRWGSATASYQIEGAVHDGGRGQSIWDTFAHTPGATHNGDTGEVAVDHYHRYHDDVAIMRDLGLQSYRFSIAWPRIQPTGAGPVNARGIAFYDRLLDALLAADIRPWVTLYHWDLPQALEDHGGWPHRDTAYRFADYAAAVHERFADRVSDWSTLNEPWCSAFLGYFNGVHAPGRREPASSLRAAHHLLLGHGLAVERMRAERPDHRYSITVNLYPCDPQTDSAADRDAARRVDGVSNRIFTDPLFAGIYPADVIADLGELWPADMIDDADLGIISVPLDAVGVNYYTRHVVCERPDGSHDPSEDLGWIGCRGVGKVDRGLPKTTMGWEVDPAGLFDVLSGLHERYPGHPPLYVTENGAAYDDVVADDGRVHDGDRSEYLIAHAQAMLRAIEHGIDLRGYFVWSLLDNFEWSFGYSQRFGIVYVDYPTQQRVIKDSARTFSRIIATRNPEGAIDGV